MSGVKRHDQVPECGQNQSDCRGECPRMHAGPGTGKGYEVGIATVGLCWAAGGSNTAGQTRTGTTRAAGWLADCGGGGIWLTLTGSFSEGEGRGLVESSRVEWSGGATAPCPPLLVPSLGASSIGPRQGTSRAWLVIGAGRRALTTEGVANNSLRCSWSVISCKRPRNLVGCESPEPQCREARASG